MPGFGLAGFDDKMCRNRKKRRRLSTRQQEKWGLILEKIGEPAAWLLQNPISEEILFTEVYDREKERAQEKLRYEYKILAIEIAKNNIEVLTNEECLLFWQMFPFHRVLDAILQQRVFEQGLLVKYEVPQCFLDRERRFRDWSDRHPDWEHVIPLMEVQSHLKSLPLWRQIRFFSIHRSRRLAAFILTIKGKDKHRKILSQLMEINNQSLFKNIFETRGLNTEKIISELALCGISFSEFKMNHQEKLVLYMRCITSNWYESMKLQIAQHLFPLSQLSEGEALRLYEQSLTIDPYTWHVDETFRALHAIIQDLLEPSSPISSLAENFIVFLDNRKKVMEETEKKQRYR
jgi:hypothetical protein